MPEPMSGCVLWLGCVNLHGYGRLRHEGRARLAHRVSYEVANGPIPEGLQLLHKCDNPGCINPQHLKPGTNADNVADMVAKGRQSCTPRPLHKGARNHNSRFDEALVRQVLLSDLSQPDAAKEFGMSRAWVQRIRAREVWTHLDVPLAQIARPARALMAQR